MNHASLFSGIGGFDLAAHWMGWQNIFWCENDEFCNKILGYYFPNAIPYGNIKETDFRKHHGQIDILTGGFPCQPFSDAGLKGGTSDPRYLWPEMHRAIREIRPRWVIAENVRGLISWNGGMVFDTVCDDLENEGYKVWSPFLLPACGVGAPHQRYRIWFVAYSDSKRSDIGAGTCIDNTKEKAVRTDLFVKTDRLGIQRIIADSDNARNTTLQCENYGNIEADSIERKFAQFELGRPRASMLASDPAGNGLQKRCKERTSTIGRKVTGFDGFPTQSPVCGGNDGLSCGLDGITFPKWRQQSIKGFGNAIVPQIAMQIFKTIVDFERTLKLFE